jgi:HAD superfamily hydrolase (TIGR01509 family)
MEYKISADTKGLIFDFDGTLVDSMPVHFLSWKKAFAAFGAEFDEQFFYANAGVSLFGVVEKYNLENKTALNPKAVVAAKDKYHAAFLPETKLIQPVMDIVVKNFGALPMAVATGNSKNLTVPLMERLNLFRFFKAVIFGEDVRHSKPHPECFQKAASAMGIPADKCEVFEDGEPGLAAARRAGMKAVDVRPWLAQPAG